MKKSTIFIISVILIFFILFFLLIGINENKREIFVGGCPTFYSLLDELKDIEKINIVKTGSTEESLKMLDSGDLDIVISGRALKENEFEFNYKNIGYGYDFISNNEFVIKEDEMIFIPFYTDLDSRKIINDFQHISLKNIKEVDNIDNYLDKGVVITFLDDRIKGEVVHIFDDRDLRVRLSRNPRIYYLNKIEEDIFKKIEIAIGKY